MFNPGQTVAVQVFPPHDLIINSAGGYDVHVVVIVHIDSENTQGATIATIYDVFGPIQTVTINIFPPYDTIREGSSAEHVNVAVAIHIRR
ncbi:hypothetical protein BMS3Bbin04_01377 [bacterium BMS3Bbin04]|nr:hypothetical protein BMS3Bbin04_01377 [bacterium BMS3Bbin04]